MIKEDLLHYAWKTKQFNFKDLLTTGKENIEILDFGIHNGDAGPDFLNARIKINDILWMGNVEIHVYASDWLKHKHQFDPAYDNVILHVVYEHDTDIIHKDGSKLATLELKKRISKELSTAYFKLLTQKEWVPCQSQIHNVDLFIIELWLENLAVERLIRKTREIKQSLSDTNGDWEYAFFISLCRSFGTRVNRDAFESLARSLDYKTLLKHRDHPLQIEALLFGQSGFLDFTPIDNYPKNLKREYAFLSKKHQLKRISKNQWKLLRMRPVNFPTIRIAQIAALIQSHPFLFSRMLEAKNVAEIYSNFSVEIDPYWIDHFLFDKISIVKPKHLGKAMIDLIIINTISPFLFTYGVEIASDHLKEKAIKFLNQVKSEKNQILTQWHKLGIFASSAYQSQALIQLKNHYCDKKKCLDCRIGHAILKSK